MKLTIETAERALAEAGALNPGKWTDHSRYVAMACRNIAEKCPRLDSDAAYLCGLLHDIGRYAGITSEKHLIDGYRYCMERGWKKQAQICISHGFIIQDIEASIGKWDVSTEDYLFIKDFLTHAVYDDYDLLVQLCDGLALPSGFCLLEIRMVDVALRYGTPAPMLPRWRKLFEVKKHFEMIAARCSVYDLLPGVIENSFR